MAGQSKQPASQPACDKPKLNLRQQKFVDEYCKSGNVTQSAIKAGYAETTADRHGRRLLGNHRVHAAISMRMEEARTKNVADTTEILEYLTSVMRGQHEDEVVMNIGKGNGITAAEKVAAKVGAKERLKAAEMLAKVNGLFLNKQEIELSQAVQVVITDDI